MSWRSDQNTFETRRSLKNSSNNYKGGFNKNAYLWKIIGKTKMLKIDLIEKTSKGKLII